MADVSLPLSVKYIPELFDYIEDKRKDEKIALLRQYVDRGTPLSKVLFEVYRFTYDPELNLDLPPGVPPLVDLKIVDYSKAPHNLYMFFSRRVPYLSKRLPRYIEKDMKREKFFIQFLEGLFHRDRDLVIQVKDKKLTEWKGINEALFRDAFPSWATFLSATTETESTEEEVTETPSTASEATPTKEEAPVVEKKDTPTKTTPKKRGPGRPRKQKPVSKYTSE